MIAFVPCTRRARSTVGYTHYRVSLCEQDANAAKWAEGTSTWDDPSLRVRIDSVKAEHAVRT